MASLRFEVEDAEASILIARNGGGAVARAWVSIDRVETPDGVLELRRRGDDDFMMSVDGRVLMTSAARRSEEALGEAVREPLAALAVPRVLIAGLGLGHTLRSALDALPGSAVVHVAELNPVVVRWCRGELSALTGGAASDPRVEIEVTDVSGVIAKAAAKGKAFDAILLDLYVGPTGKISANDPFYGPRALENARAALSSGGLLGIWSEARSETFERALAKAGFQVSQQRVGRGGRRHCIYLATRPSRTQPRGS
jgi:spermidine synthase